MKKTIFIVMLMMFMFTPSIKVQAVYTDIFEGWAQFIDNTWVAKDNGNIKKTQKLTVIKRKSDGHYVYCIEPGTGVIEGKTINGYDSNIEQLGNITKANLERTKLLAYYGYEYGNHTDLLWYSVTQFMIWQTVPHGYDIYFTDKLNGPRITKYIDEMKEMEQLLQNHYKKPSFDGTSHIVYLGNSLTLIDSNNVLENYDIDNSDIIKESNKLTIKPISTTKVTLTKQDKRFDHPPIAYIDDESQDVLLTGSYDPIYSKFNIEVKSGSITILKVGEEAIYENESYKYNNTTLEGVKYGIYFNNEPFGIKKTDDKGKIYFDNLPMGEYYIKELESSNGNMVDKTKIHFKIDENNLNQLFELYNKLPKGELELLKVDSKTNTPLEGAEIEVYNEDSLLVYKGITDESGLIYISDLPLGKYSILETKAPEEYEIKEDRMYFEIKENEEVTTVTMTNDKIEPPVLIVEIPHKEIEPPVLTVEIPYTKIDSNVNYALILMLLILVILFIYKKPFKISRVKYLLVGLLLIVLSIPQNMNEVDIIKTYITYKNSYLMTNTIGIIEIPKINLKKELVNPDSEENTVDKNIEIIKPSDMPNKPNGNLILAAHSGKSTKAYFKNIHKLNTDDMIYVYYNNVKYIYKITSIYNEERDGDINIIKDTTKTTLTLTTCSGKDQQLVLIATLINKK